MPKKKASANNDEHNKPVVVTEYSLKAKKSPKRDPKELLKMSTEKGDD